MGMTFEKADDVTVAMADRLLAEYHPNLHELGLRFEILFADAGEDKEGSPKAALKDAGYVVPGITSRTNLEQRALGAPDIVIKLDAAMWGDMEDAERKALLDHLFHHWMPSCDKNGDPKLDTWERPILVRRLYDVRAGIYHTILQRHKAKAIEAGALRKLILSPSGQILMKFIDEVRNPELPSAPAGGKKRQRRSA